MSRTIISTKKEIASDKGKQEADFIIVDKEIQSLINVEVKTFLGKYPGLEKRKEDWPKEKVKKQMRKVREILGDSFQFDIGFVYQFAIISYTPNGTLKKRIRY